jgi:hypothetical protein
LLHKMYIFSLYDQVLKQFIIRSMQLMLSHSKASYERVPMH